MHPLKGLKICKGWNSCHTHNISHVRSLHLGKLGWMSGTSFNTLSWIYQSINLSTLISHKKSRGYGNKKMIINMSTNCRNKMKSEDLCQGVETAAEKKHPHMIDSNGELLLFHFMAFVTIIVSVLHDFFCPIYPHHLSASFALGTSSSEGNNFSAGSCIVRTKQSTACEHVR